MVENTARRLREALRVENAERRHMAQLVETISGGSYRADYVAQRREELARLEAIVVLLDQAVGVAQYGVKVNSHSEAS
jgi:hypothetical protein